jgi:hypothetical protein
MWDPNLSIILWSLTLDSTSKENMVSTPVKEKRRNGRIRSWMALFF